MKIQPKSVVWMILFGLLWAGCNKNEQVAKDLDGEWEAVRLKWEGSGSTSAGEDTDSLGTWTFVSCNTPKETCSGEVVYADGTVENFDWRIEDDGESFVIGAEKSTAEIHQMGGKWEIVTHTDNKFVITSESCGGCSNLGKETVELNR